MTDGENGIGEAVLGRACCILWALRGLWDALVVPWFLSVWRFGMGYLTVLASGYECMNKMELRIVCMIAAIQVNANSSRHAMFISGGVDIIPAQQLLCALTIFLPFIKLLEISISLVYEYFYHSHHSPANTHDDLYFMTLADI
jgi:hypothetical protein